MTKVVIEITDAKPSFFALLDDLLSNSEPLLREWRYTECETDRPTRHEPRDSLIEREILGEAFEAAQDRYHSVLLANATRQLA